MAQSRGAFIERADLIGTGSRTTTSVQDFAVDSRDNNLASHCIAAALPESESGGLLSRALGDTSQARFRPTRVTGTQSVSSRPSNLALYSILQGKR